MIVLFGLRCWVVSTYRSFVGSAMITVCCHVDSREMCHINYILQSAPCFATEEKETIKITENSLRYLTIALTLFNLETSRTLTREKMHTTIKSNE